MPTFTRYDHTARVAILEANGEVSREEATAQIRAVCMELAERQETHPGREYGVLVDTRRSDTVPTPADIRHVLDEIGTRGGVAPPNRWAILATKPVHYGMGRLFQAHAEARGLDVRVFDTRETAIAWLTEPPPDCGAT